MRDHIQIGKPVVRVRSEAPLLLSKAPPLGGICADSDGVSRNPIPPIRIIGRFGIRPFLPRAATSVISGNYVSRDTFRPDHVVAAEIRMRPHPRR